MAEGDPTPLSLLSRSIDALAERVREVEEDVEHMPVLEAKFDGLVEEVKKLTKAQERNNSLMIGVGLTFLTAGIMPVVVALILKGVIG